MGSFPEMSNDPESLCLLLRHHFAGKPVKCQLFSETNSSTVYKELNSSYL